MSVSEVDAFLFSFINQSLQNSVFDVFMPFVTKRAWVLFLPVYLWSLRRDKNLALRALLLGIASVLLTDWAANSLKEAIARIRPCAAYADARVLVGCGKSFSLPSNHAANAFALVVPFVVLYRKSVIMGAFLAIAIVVGFSRVYVGVHYPADVIVGALVGVSVSFCCLVLARFAEKKFSGRPFPTFLGAFLLCVGLFRIYYILNGPFDLSPDEAHYWEWSRRLDLSYYSKGPMIAYLIRIGTGLFGDTVFGIRSMAVVFLTLGSIVLYALGKRMYDEKTGVLAAVLLHVIPLFAVFGIIFTIDSPFLFFWILALYLFYRIVSDLKGAPGRSIALWTALGAAIGLGLLTKYTMAFFYPCAFLFLCLDREKRRILLTKGPFLAVIVSILVFSPVIIWNAQHDWVTLKHTAGQAHLTEGIRLSLKSFGEFVASQLGVLTPLVFVLMLVALFVARRRKHGAFLFWFSIPVLAFFLAKSIQGKVQANWALPAYVSGVLAYAAYVLETFSSRGAFRKAIVVGSLVLAFSVTAVGHYPSLLNLPRSLDPTARLTGWKELGNEVSTLYEEISAGHPAFIFSDRYQVSSQLAFYVRGHPVTFCMKGSRRMNQYDLWPSFGDLVHYHAIFVKTGDVSAPDAIVAAFEKVEKKVVTAYTKNHEKIRDYTIFLCYDFRGLVEEAPTKY